MTGFHPTTRDLQAWRTLCKQARRMAAEPAGAAGDLRAAAASANRAVAPSAEALKYLCAPLTRLGLAYATMDTVTRQANVERLLHLAEGLEPLVGVEAPTITGLVRAMASGTRGEPLRFQPPVEPEETLTPRPPRADIYG